MHRFAVLVTFALVVSLSACGSSSTTPDSGSPDAGATNVVDAGVDAGCGLPSWTAVMPAGATATIGYSLLTLTGKGPVDACLQDSCTDAVRVSLDGVTGDFDAQLDIVSLEARASGGGAVDGGALPSIGLYAGSPSGTDHVAAFMTYDTNRNMLTAHAFESVAGGSSDNSATVQDLRGHLEVRRVGDQLTFSVTSGANTLSNSASMTGPVRLAIVLGEDSSDPTVVTKAVVARFTGTGAVQSDPFLCRTLAP